MTSYPILHKKYRQSTFFLNFRYSTNDSFPFFFFNLFRALDTCCVWSLKLEPEKSSDPAAFNNVRQHLNFEPNFQMTYVKNLKAVFVILL